MNGVFLFASWAYHGAFLRLSCGMVCIHGDTDSAI